MTVSISNDTLSVLRNFSSINPNVVLKPGQEVKTISEAKNILAVAEIAEDFPTEMGIYDLNEFLSVVNLVNDPKLSFGDNHVDIVGGNSKVKYFFSDSSILTTPQKDITMPSCEVEVSFTHDTLSQIRKAASALGHSEMSITATDEGVNIKVFDSKDSSANIYNIQLANDAGYTEGQFEFVININNLKLLDGDYEVKISSKLISEWKNTTQAVRYYIALEKNSNYNSQ
tara:strand:- start:8644 stop:9327 length:684 start_codon:yes stop_codon:yes gene_type:complete